MQVFAATGKQLHHLNYTHCCDNVIDLLLFLHFSNHRVDAR